MSQRHNFIDRRPDPGAARRAAFEAKRSGKVAYSTPFGPIVMVSPGMIQPVSCCNCGGVFDLASVRVIANYGECSTFITPCCGRHTDDREYVNGIRRMERVTGRAPASPARQPAGKGGEST